MEIVSPLPESANGQEPEAARAQSHWAELPAAGPSPSAPGRAVIDDVSELITEINGTLVPAYHAAVDALDSAGALALAQAVASGVQRLEQARDAFRHGLTGAGAADDESLQGRALDFARLAAIEGQIASVESHLKVTLGPQTLAGKPLAGAVSEPTGKRGEAGPIEEAANVVGILGTVDEVKALLGHGQGGCEAATPENVVAATNAVEKWRGRPANWRFLVAALNQEGLWQLIADTKTAGGQTLAKVDRTVDEHAKQFGELEDVGSFDEEKVKALVPVEEPGLGTTDQGVAAPTASPIASRAILDMLESAAPAARGSLVKRLLGMGRLDVLCDALPRRKLEELMQSIDDPDVKALLAKKVEGQGGGTSVTSMIEGQIQESLRDAEKAKNRSIEEPADIQARLAESSARSSAFGWQVLLTGYHGLTFGFTGGYDEAYDGQEAGLISPNEFTSSVTNQALKSGALALATTLTGGAVGSWASGVSKALGAGQGLQAVIGGTLGGGAAGLAGQGVEDVFDGHLSGLDDYGQATLYGMGGGALTSGVAVAGSKYLPESAKTLGQVYAERHPELESFFREWSSQGLDAGKPIRVAAAKLKALIAEGLVPPAEGQAALASAGDQPGSFLVRPSSRPDGKLLVSFYGSQEIAEHYVGETQHGREGRPDHVTAEEVADATGMHEASARAAGAASGVRHHVFPQEYRAWFAAHGFEDIDAFTVEMPGADHEALHGGGDFRLGRRAWPGEWNKRIWKALLDEEAFKTRTGGGKLTREDILDIGKKQMSRYDIAETFVRYRSSREENTPSLEEEGGDASLGR